MSNPIWEQLAEDRTVRMARQSYEYTRLSMQNLRRTIRLDDFGEEDAQLIYDALFESLSVSFGDYLKRYVYQKAEMTEPFDEVSIKEYQYVIAGSFKDTQTPRSFRETTQKMSAMIKGWLSRDTVSREVVFLLGFGLNMKVEEVSDFLTKGLLEQDFNFKDPNEVICWYCLKNHWNFRKAAELMEAYKELEVPEDEQLDEDGTVALRGDFQGVQSEKSLMEMLRRLKAMRRHYPYSGSSRKEFDDLYAEAVDRVFEIHNADPEIAPYSDASQVTPGDLEKELYSGVPMNEKGNLQKASASRLAGRFKDKRLSRQRISSIQKGKAAVDRYDLFTLLFFITAVSTDEMEDPYERCRKYIVRMNEILEHCFMGELNITNTYESFLLMCLLSEEPMDTFAEVWELSYRQDMM